MPFYKEIEVGRPRPPLAATSIHDGIRSQRLGYRRLFVLMGATCTLMLLLLTQSSPARALPDRRVWEMVSPSEKHGAFVEPLQTRSAGAGGAIQASEDGDGFTYVTDQSPVTDAQGEANLSQQYATRSAGGGWSGRDISAPHLGPTDTSLGEGPEFRMFSPDLLSAVVGPIELNFTPLSPQATERTPYIRNQVTNAYAPLLTPADVAPGTKFGGKQSDSRDPVGGVGASPDLTDVVLHTEGLALTSTPVVGGGLYEWSTAGLRLVSTVVPGGEAVDGELGYKDTDVRNAVSEDGSRVFWEGEANGERAHLYLSEPASGNVLQLDVVQAGASGNERVNPEFQAASGDGSRVFFTDSQQLTPGSTAEEERPDLYMCTVETGPACRLSDLTGTENPADPAEWAGVLGIPAVSKEGTTVYLAARGLLTSTPNAAGEKAHSDEENLEASDANLYVLRDKGEQWTTAFIANLSEQDAHDWTAAHPGYLGPVSSRASPDGRYFTFMSQRPLTGYDNTDVNNGAADEEVFLYESESRRLVCASCNPTGARPSGVFDSSQSGLLVDPSGQPAWEEHWLAASLPGWTGIAEQRAVYQSRYLSDNGRLFFNSADALVPQDVNGKEDVYEYEPPGVGNCAPESTTFGATSGGCVDLISSGTSSLESAFLDASEGGRDIFFITAAPLVQQDTDAQFDVYDAHECTPAAPCASTATSEPRESCASASSCRIAPAPQPGVFGAPASATFSGAGNFSPPNKPKPKTVVLTQAQKLARALKVCRRKHDRHTRATCERQARKRYGPPKSHSRSKSSKRGK